MNQPFTVLWDGRRGGPGGSQLFTNEYQPPATPIAPDRQCTRLSEATVREAVTEHLARAPMTQRELAAATGLGKERINSALYYMRQTGLVAIIAERQMSTAKYGRTAEYVYAFRRRQSL